MNKRDSRRSYLDRNNDWRKQAHHLRQLAAQPHLAPETSAALAREANAADAAANEWLTAAIELPFQYPGDDP